jgi:hypothetical protein
MAEKLELTEREIAIAKGEDPDAVAKPEQKAESKVETNPAESGKDSESGKEAASDGVVSDWIDDEVRSLQGAYGLSEEDLKEFNGGEDFRKALSFYDKQLVKRSAKADTKPDTKPEAAQNKAETQPANKTESKPDEFDLDPEQYKKAGYDEETVRVVRVAKELREQVKALTAKTESLSKRTEDEDRHRAVFEFHDHVDRMDESLYGRSADDDGNYKDLSPEQDANRRKLHEGLKTIVAAIERDAREAGVEPKYPTFASLLKRAENFALGEELRKKTVERVRQDASNQSKQIRQVNRGKPVTPVTKKTVSREESEVSEIANDPKVRAFWDKATQENGTE